MEAIVGNFALKLMKIKASARHFIIYPLTIILFHLSDFQEGAENKRTCYQECAGDCANLLSRAACGGTGETLPRTKR